MAFAGLSESQLKEVFDTFDADGSGFISRQELLNILTKLAEVGAIDADSDECKASTAVSERLAMLFLLGNQMRGMCVNNNWV